jgi:hypothetical protein
MRFLVTDQIHDEPGLAFSEATAVIASWWDNEADFNEIEDAEEREHVRSDMARFVDRRRRLRDLDSTTMTEQQIIARMVELFRDPALDDDDSAESAEFDCLESQLVEQVGEWRVSCILDRILVSIGEL